MDYGKSFLISLACINYPFLCQLSTLQTNVLSLIILLPLIKTSHLASYSSYVKSTQPQDSLKDPATQLFPVYTPNPISCQYLSHSLATYQN